MKNTDVVRLTSRRAAEGMGHAGKIGNNSLDSITFAFNFGLHAFHFVTVERVGDILSRESANFTQKLVGVCPLPDEC